MAKEIKFIHNLRGKGRPQILLIGNGVERVYGSVSWDKLIDSIDVHEFSEEICDEINKLPFPLKYELLATPDNVSVNFSRDDIYAEEKRIADAMRTLLPGRESRERDKNEKHNKLFKKLPSLGVDHIFTTNYSYCPEEGYYPDREFEKNLFVEIFDLTLIRKRMKKDGQVRKKGFGYTRDILSRQAIGMPRKSVFGIFMVNVARRPVLFWDMISMEGC